MAGISSGHFYRLLLFSFIFTFFVVTFVVIHKYYDRLYLVQRVYNMKNLKLKTDPKVNDKFNNYPELIREKMQFLRELVIETAGETHGVDVLEETLKWGEPSFITKNGSTLRMDWKEKSPKQYAMYFQCSSRLVDTFRMVFGNQFRYEGKRAIIFQLNEKIPVNELKECIKATLLYHDVKHLQTLGI